MLFHSINPRLGNIAGVKEELAPLLLAIHLFLPFFHALQHLSLFYLPDSDIRQKCNKCRNN